MGLGQVTDGWPGELSVPKVPQELKATRYRKAKGTAEAVPFPVLVACRLDVLRLVRRQIAGALYFVEIQACGGELSNRET